MGCAASPASLHKLEDWLRATWGGYQVDVPVEAVQLHGFEVTVVPSEDDHEDRAASNATVLPHGEWVDGVLEHDDDHDLFVFRGKRNVTYDYFIYTRHSVESSIQSDGVGRGWKQINLHESGFLCHLDYGIASFDNHDVL